MVHLFNEKSQEEYKWSMPFVTYNLKCLSLTVWRSNSPKLRGSGTLFVKRITFRFFPWKMQDGLVKRVTGLLKAIVDKAKIAVSPGTESEVAGDDGNQTSKAQLV